MLIPLFAFVLAQFDSGRFPDPVTFTSLSGDFVLHVESTTNDGLESALYTLNRGSKHLWTKELGFALSEVALNGAGLAVGCGVDRTEGRSTDFVVAIISAEGEVVMEDRSPQAWRRNRHLPYDALSKALIPDFEHGRFSVRMDPVSSENRVESWRRFDIGRGKYLDSIEPETLMGPDMPDARARLMHATALPGSDLHLIQWQTRGTGLSSRASDTRFTLIDRGGREVWRLDQAKNTDDESYTERQTQKTLRGQNLILGLGPPGTFDLHFVHDHQRVRFQVTPDQRVPGEWLVRETSRIDFVPPSPIQSEPDPVLDRLELVELQAIQLQGHGSIDTAPIYGAYGWSFTKGGELIVIHRDSQAPFKSVIFDADGKLIAESEFAPAPESLEGETTRWDALGGGKWLVSAPSQETEGAAQFWLADEFTASFTGFPDSILSADFDGEFEFDFAASVNANSFAVLGTRTEDYIYTWDIFVFDLAGQLLWSIEVDESKPTNPQNPVHFAGIKGGGLAVLNNDDPSVQVFDQYGKHVRTLDLLKLFEPGDRQPQTITVDPSGSEIVLGFRAQGYLWSLDIDGSNARVIKPHTVDQGPRPVLNQGARFDSNGTLWVPDGYMLRGLDENGVIRQMVGSPKNKRRIHEVGIAAVLGDGRACVLDARTGALHVWRVSGEHRFKAKAAEGDLKLIDRYGEIATDRDGAIWVEAQTDSWPEDFLGWDSNGLRLGLRNFGHGVAFVPGSELTWTWGYAGGATLQNSGRSTLASVTRHPNRNWIQQISTGHVGTDGKLLIVDHDGRRGRSSTTLLEFDSDGSHISSHPIPKVWSRRDNLQSAGDWALLAGIGRTVILLDRRRNRLGTFTLPSSSGFFGWAHGLSRDGQRLLSLDPSTMRLHQFALPK